MSNHYDETVPVTFSVFLPQAGLRYAQLRERVRLAEQLGYDGCWLVDHMWSRGHPDVDFLEAWTTVAALAEATTRLRLGVLVTCNAYRNPGMLAKAVTSADHVSNGRIELGMGAGWMEEEYRAYGFDFPDIPVRLAQLDESLTVVRSLFETNRTTIHGRYYMIRDAPFNPKPIQHPLPITIGGAGPKRLMRIVARHAQRWNCPMNATPRMEEHRQALLRHCDSLGRDANEIVISEQLPVVVGADAQHYRSKRTLAQLVVGDFVGDIDSVAACGTPDEVATTLRAKVSRGVRDFALLFGDLGMPDTLELFATRVMPRLAAS